MSDIVDDLRELRVQMATVVDDEIILTVFDRAVTEIIRLRGLLHEEDRVDDEQS